jgi:hypothetical protein
MKTLTVRQQIDLLRPALGFVRHVHKWFWMGAALGVVAAIVFWHPAPLFFSALLALVGFFEQKAGPALAAAIAAYDDGTPSNGQVAVTLVEGDSVNFYHAVVREPNHPDWEFAFFPQGWQPSTRIYHARLWRENRSGQPVLAAVDEGLLIPRDQPRLRAENPLDR